MEPVKNGIPDTVALDEEHNELVIIDQSRLPGETVFLRITQTQPLVEAIVNLRVRGAPAIGVAAAIGIYVISSRFEESGPAAFAERFLEVRDTLAASRPTAVNLFWALGRMARVVTRYQGGSVAQIKEKLHDEACAIRDEDIDVCRRIGEHGAALLEGVDSVLTHCNAGRLAAVRYGTALAPVYCAASNGRGIKVYADETRPLLQGARLTAYELSQAGIDVTLICDNMASGVMAAGRVQAVLVGCDRVAANGDTANKTGTSGVAILADYYHIPFYVCAPSSSIDFACPDGGAINIEQRPASEIREQWYTKPMAPPEAAVYNPAFDVTKAGLITAFITEHGVIRPPFLQNLRTCIQQV